MPFSDEITHARLFLDILCDKYGDDFQASVDIPEACLNTMVPKLLLQPIIENTVEHGADFERRGPLHVTLSASMEEAEDACRLHIVVRDDGIGMRYAGTIAMEVYMRGVMDRARPHYAVVSRELPYQPDGP